MLIYLSLGQVSKNSINNVDNKEYINLIYQKCLTADILEIDHKGDYIEIEYLYQPKANGEDRL
jgi:hypothetical protein